MNQIANYLNFLKEKGKPLSEINPGSHEFALTVEDALSALILLEGVSILGGNILSLREGQLIYAYQFWGQEYHYLNWNCSKVENESEEDYAQRSHRLAKESVHAANKVAKKFKKPCYIVFVI